MKVGVYARVSTSDKDQKPETQLVPLRDFCQAEGWEVYREYVDQAPATDLTHRVQWRQLLDGRSRLAMSPKPTSREESGPAKGLTPIHRRIHWAATRDSGGTGADEVEQIQVNHFLEILTGIDLAWAARRVAQDPSGGQVE